MRRAFTPKFKKFPEKFENANFHTTKKQLKLLFLEIGTFYIHTFIFYHLDLIFHYLIFIHSKKNSAIWLQTKNNSRCGQYKEKTVTCLRVLIILMFCKLITCKKADFISLWILFVLYNWWSLSKKMHWKAYF